MKTKRKITLLAAVICLVAAGCSGKPQTQETLSESQAESIAESLTGMADEMVDEQINAAESMAEAATGSADFAVPVPLMYTGEDPYMPAVLRWMEEDPATYYDTGDYYIPAPAVFYTDDTDPEDIRIWGNFWVFRYDLADGNLLLESGGAHPGLLHLKTSDGDALGYEAVGFEAVQDGSDYDSSLKEICAKAPAEAGDLYTQYTEAADNDTYEQVRKEYLRMYAEQVPFPIKSYQDPGWDPVMLEE